MDTGRNPSINIFLCFNCGRDKGTDNKNDV